MACRWCKREHDGKPVWHRTCAACGEPYEQPRKVGRPRETCGKKICVLILRYQRIYGRWPPKIWFARYASAASCPACEARIEKVASGPPVQRDLFAKVGAA